MSTPENTPDNVEVDNLDAFAADFFGQNDSPEDGQEEEANPSEEEAEDTEDEVAHDDEDTQSDDEPEETDEEEVEPQPKKKQSAQERINQAVGRQREAERKYEEALKRLEQLEQKDTPRQESPKSEPKSTGPTPSDKDDDGNDKYALGEFDPQYIADLTAYQMDLRFKEYQEKQAKAEAETEAAKQRQALETNWQEKVAVAKERYPDFDEKGNELVSVFQNLDAQYGEYLATTLMNLEYGHDVLYYLSNNLDEAQEIVQKGPTGAVIALGRLDGKFADNAVEKKQAKPKVSKAPTPPPTNKGSAAARSEVPVDTDDLEAFSHTFFKK